ncbi:MAG: riboflavin synthase [Deltaproteobacteria bacterium]|nr:riboflavin synthase [Deltaproteobacteria bacterium]
MFTGIVEDIGSLDRVQSRGAVRVFRVKTKLDLGDTKLGDSIAVNGVCLTVTHLVANAGVVEFDVGPESLEVTVLSELKSGSRVHLERALRLSDRLGGHLMQGHVDGIGKVRRRDQVGDTLKLGVRLDKELLRYCIHKGSIALNGVSLTLNSVDDEGVEVWLIPHSLEQTLLGQLRMGASVHVETDVIGKYVERLLLSRADVAEPQRGGVTFDLLKRSGF